MNVRMRLLQNLANQNIWLNKNICFKGKPPILPNWTKIYKYKMKSRIVKDQVTYEGVCRFLKNALMQLYFTIKKTKCINSDFKILELLSQNL